MKTTNLQYIGSASASENATIMHSSIQSGPNSSNTQYNLSFLQFFLPNQPSEGIAQAFHKLTGDKIDFTVNIQDVLKKIQELLNLKAKHIDSHTLTTYQEPHNFSAFSNKLCCVLTAIFSTWQALYQTISQDPQEELLSGVHKILRENAIFFMNPDQQAEFVKKCLKRSLKECIDLLKKEDQTTLEVANAFMERFYDILPRIKQARRYEECGHTKLAEFYREVANKIIVSPHCILTAALKTLSELPYEGPEREQELSGLIAKIKGKLQEQNAVPKKLFIYMTFRDIEIDEHFTLYLANGEEGDAYDIHFYAPVEIEGTRYQTALGANRPAGIDYGIIKGHQFERREMGSPTLNPSQTQIGNRNREITQTL